MRRRFGNDVFVYQGRFGLLAIVLLVAVTGLVAVIAPATMALASLTTGPYVALGDSYAAGPGILNQVDLNCMKSDHDYPALVASTLRPPAFRDMSCSGATTNDMANSQTGALGLPVPPQLDGLTADTKLVTLTIGGNDIGFSSVVQTCALLSLFDLFGAPCTAHYTQGGTDRLAAAIAAAAPKVAAVIRAIHLRSPHALVLVVGYLDILPLAGTGCWPLVAIAPGDLPYLRGVENLLNQMLAGQASQGHATYVDTFTPSIGHDACQLPGVKWVEGIIPLSPGYPVHPNLLGMQGDATAVLAAIQ